MQDTEYICKTQNCPFVRNTCAGNICETRTVWGCEAGGGCVLASRGIISNWCVCRRRVGAVWWRMGGCWVLGGGARVEAGGCLYTAPVCSPLAISWPDNRSEHLPSVLIIFSPPHKQCSSPAISQARHPHYPGPDHRHPGADPSHPEPGILIMGSPDTLTILALTTATPERIHHIRHHNPIITSTSNS